MCRMCETLGEGMIWYKNPKMYANRMYKLREPGRGPQTTIQASETGAEGPLAHAIEAKANGDMETYHRIIKEINERDKLRPGCHVVPLKDAMEIMDYAPVAAMMCICRKRARGDEETNLREYSCMGLGTGMFKWERWPERYRGGVEFLSPSEAKDWLDYWDKRGYVHIIMQEGGDFIGGMCNCNYPDCGPIRHRIDYGLDYQLVKAEYVAIVDYSRCNGCGDCFGRCHFNALKPEVNMDAPSIDQFQCYGCGLCETACRRRAISLIERKKLPALRNVW